MTWTNSSIKNLPKQKPLTLKKKLMRLTMSKEPKVAQPAKRSWQMLKKRCNLNFWVTHRKLSLPAVVHRKQMKMSSGCKMMITALTQTICLRVHLATTTTTPKMKCLMRKWRSSCLASTGRQAKGERMAAKVTNLEKNLKFIAPFVQVSIRKTNANTKCTTSRVSWTVWDSDSQMPKKSFTCLKTTTINIATDTEVVRGETGRRTEGITTVGTNLLPGKTKITKATKATHIATKNPLKITKWDRVGTLIIGNMMAGKILMIAGLPTIIMPRTVIARIIEGRIILTGIRKTTITHRKGLRNRIRHGTNRQTTTNKANWDQLTKRICTRKVLAGRTNKQVMGGNIIKYGATISILRAVTKPIGHSSTVQIITNISKAAGRRTTKIFNAITASQVTVRMVSTSNGTLHRVTTDSQASIIELSKFRKHLQSFILCIL